MKIPTRSTIQELLARILVANVFYGFATFATTSAGFERVLLHRFQCICPTLLA